MNALEHIICTQIARTGPLNIAEFMALCLYHPEHGYYRTAPAIGATGDFITAPEISQTFGELLGLTIAQAWQDQDAPDPFHLVEFGPGSGQLMCDALRATAHVPGFIDAMRLHLIETNQTLKTRQAKKLAHFNPHWHDDQTTLPDGPLFVIANEFFDCLPIRQFMRSDTGWCERMVGNQGGLCFVKSQTPAAKTLDQHCNDRANWHELRPAANALIGDLTQCIATHGGAAIIIDYGDWGSQANTLQAIHQHKKSNPLDQLGNSDLTAWVDFQALARAGSVCAHSALTPQGLFLERLGMTARMQSLAKNLSGDALQNHIGAHERLCHPDQMGNLFKVLGFWPKGAPPIAGLDQQ